MFVRKSSNGKLYVCKARGVVIPGPQKKYSNIHLIKANTYSGQISIRHISFPKEMIGKRVRLCVEIIGPQE